MDRVVSLNSAVVCYLSVQETWKSLVHVGLVIDIRKASWLRVSVEGVGTVCFLHTSATNLSPTSLMDLSTLILPIFSWLGVYVIRYFEGAMSSGFWCFR